MIRIRKNPHRIGRESRFYGSHTGGAWLILASIATIVITLFVYRGAQINTGTFPYDSGAFVSEWVATLLAPLGLVANEWIETVFILLSFGAVLGTTILVLYSKHMHIFLAPFNVLFSRRPNGLGPLLPMYSGADEDRLRGPRRRRDLRPRRRSTDFTWKGNLDLLTCTECGRCQSQCPAWNTEKPLSPKLLIMDLRDNLLAQAPYLVGEGQPGLPRLARHGQGVGAGAPSRSRSYSQAVQDAHARPLVGSRETDNAVIDEDVLWSCTTCGACVNQCPVDIEHIDHIVDMRRNRVMIESEFPTELAGLFKNVENKGNPWGMNASLRNAWIEEVDFDVRVFGAEGEDTIPDDVDYLFWVGCAGAFEDRAKRTTKAVAELLNLAGVQFMVLGEGETCTGDPGASRRQRVPLPDAGDAERRGPQRDQGEEDRRHLPALPQHARPGVPAARRELRGRAPQQLLASLVKDGRLTPVTPVESTVTYHDPCYLGRHNKVYTPPRELIGSLPGLTLTEMERTAERSFCCGAGGARMWMEEKLGTRINLNRTDEAIATGAHEDRRRVPVLLGDAQRRRHEPLSGSRRTRGRGGRRRHPPPHQRPHPLTGPRVTARNPNFSRLK